MSEYPRIVQDLAADDFGPTAELHLEVRRGRILAWLTRADGDGGDEVVAIAAGPDDTIACRDLLRQLANTTEQQRDQPRLLTTQQAAAVLGISRARVNARILAGSLAAVEPGSAGGPATLIAPAEVHRLLKLPRQLTAKPDDRISSFGAE